MLLLDDKQNWNEGWESQSWCIWSGSSEVLWSTSSPPRCIHPAEWIAFGFVRSELSGRTVTCSKITCASKHCFRFKKFCSFLFVLDVVGNTYSWACALFVCVFLLVYSLAHILSPLPPHFLSVVLTPPPPLSFIQSLDLFFASPMSLPAWAISHFWSRALPENKAWAC